MSAIKDPAKVRAGEIGARKRWSGHQPRIVRLDDLSPEQRRLVLALVNAARSKEKAITEVEPVTAGGGGDYGAHSAS